MEAEVLHLTKEMERNYEALQNFFNDKQVRSGKSGGHLSKTSKLNKLKAQNFQCFDCQKVFYSNIHGVYNSATVDHIIPYRYGSSIAYNCELVCQPCNNKRENNRLEVIMRFFGTIME